MKGFKIEGLSYADGNFYYLFVGNELWIFAQYYCVRGSEFGFYYVDDRPCQAYTVNKIGDRLANGQVLTEEVFDMLRTQAKTYRTFYIEEV